MNASARRAARGASAVESLIALPVLLVVGLGALQFALVYHARHALTHALIEAARSGSVDHASAAAIRGGLARGLVPWLYGASDLGEYAQALERAAAHVVEAEARGWLRLEQVSPTEASFADWAEPARDANGDPMPGVREIPNDDLVHRALRAMPAGGLAGTRAGEPIGAASGQTLADANVLRLRLEYGVPLSVPIVGRWVAATLRAWHGCAPASPAAWGALRLDAPQGGLVPRPGACTMLGAAGTDAQARPRLPVVVAATVRMQSGAREAGVGGLVASGAGSADPAPGGPPIAAGAPSGSTAGGSGAAAGPAVAAGAAGPARASPPAPAAASAGANGPSRPPMSRQPAASLGDPAFCRSADS